jgi:hypothetical protein
VSPDSDFVCIFAKEFRRVSTISLLLSCIALKIVTKILLKANGYKSAAKVEKKVDITLFFNV